MTWNRRYKKYLRQNCKRFGIKVSRFASISQLNAQLEKVALVKTPKGINFKQTDKPTAEYTVQFTIYVAHSVRAESKETACEWIERNADGFYDPFFGDKEDSGDCNIITVYKNGEEV